MKTINVANEKWFKMAELYDVKMLGIKHLEIPADRIGPDRKDLDIRNLVRQIYKQKKHTYGESFDIVEPANPFGRPAKRRSSVNNSPTGTYAWVKNGLRAVEEDVRWKMMKVIEKNTTFEGAVQEWGSDEKYSKGDDKKTFFTFKEHLEWALKRGWIIKTGE